MISTSATTTNNLNGVGWSLEGPYDDPQSLRSQPIQSTPFSVGRRQDATLTLARPNVSNVHAEISQAGTTLILRDLGSTNGTFVNGNRIYEPVVLHDNDLIQFASVPFRVRYQTHSQITCTLQEDAFEHALSLVNFDRLIHERMVTPHFQPIVRLCDRSVLGFEVLGRSSLPGLQNPKDMFRIAKKLNQEIELSVLLREEGVRQGWKRNPLPHLYVNTHPLELINPGLLDSLRAIREQFPDQPLTLEIHESAVSDRRAMAELRVGLIELDIRLAYDDFGAGQSRLNELVEVPPNVLKFDMSLIRDIHLASPSRTRMLATLVQMVRELNIVPLAEGVECAEEDAACRELQFEVGQGYFYGRPAPLQQA